MADRVDRLAREEEHVVTPRALVLLLVGAALVVLAVNALAVRLSPASEDLRRNGRREEVGARGRGRRTVAWSSSATPAGTSAWTPPCSRRRWGSPRSTSAPTVASRSSGAAWFLDEALRAGGEPATVVVVLGPDVRPRSGRAELAQVPIAPFEWSSRLPHAGLDAGRAAAFLRARTMPLLDQASASRPPR